MKITEIRTRIVQWKGPPVEVEVGNELFWYIFQGEPVAQNGCVDLDENTPGLGLTVDEAALQKFHVIE